LKKKNKTIFSIHQEKNFHVAGKRGGDKFGDSCFVKRSTFIRHQQISQLFFKSENLAKFLLFFGSSITKKFWSGIYMKRNN